MATIQHASEEEQKTPTKEPRSRPTPERKPHKMIRAAVATLGVLGIGAGAYVAGSQNADKAPVVAAAEPEATDPGVTEAREPTTSPPATEVRGERRTNVGNIDALFLQTGEPYFTFTTPTGQEVKVPELGELDPNNPSPYMGHFAAIFSACLTDPTQQTCLDAISDNPAVQQMFVDNHADTVGFLEENGISDVQVSIYDAPEDPAQFTMQEQNGSQVLSLTGGTLYFHYHDNEDWQSTEVSSLYYNDLTTNRFTQLDLYVNQPVPGEDTNITRIVWDANEVDE